MNTPGRKRAQSIIYWVEIILVLAAGYLGREWFDRLTAGMSPAWLVILLKIAAFAGLIAVAVVLHILLERYLRSRGMID